MGLSDQLAAAAQQLAALTARAQQAQANPMAGRGGINPPPLNAPPAGAVSTGVQPGVSTGIVLAQYVVVFGGKSAGIFVYEGAPAKGNPPVAWLTDSTTDPYGNSLPEITPLAGLGTYSPVTGQVVEIGLGEILLGVLGQYAAGGIWTPQAGTNVIVQSGLLTSTDQAAALSLVSKSQSGPIESPYAALENVTGPGSGIPLEFSAMAAPPASTEGQPLVFANANGTMGEMLPSGLTGTLPVTQADSTEYTVTSDSSFEQFSLEWPIPADDAQADTVYKLTVAGNGSQGASVNAIFFRIAAFGATSGEAQVGGTAFIASEAFGFELTALVVVKATGSGGSAFFLTRGTVGEFGANQSASNGNVTAFVGQNSGVSINTTAATTISVQAEWSTVTAAPTISSLCSILERVGP